MASHENEGGIIESSSIGNNPSTARIRTLSDTSNRFHITSLKGSQRLNIENLGYEVNERGSGFLQKFIKLENPFKGIKDAPKKKRILHNINFQTCSGQLLAILGSSGSGKTTLLDVISCQTHTGTIEGIVKLDGIVRTQESIKTSSAYVRQDDRLLPHLTVKETFNFVAELKLPKSWPKEKRQKRVNSVIAELGLRHVASSKVGGPDIRGISGGERRRVSIGIQLLLNPSILFLDEPTSGLDSFTAHNLVETLAKLARNNRIVIITIHQPRSDIFELFDQLILLSQGQMVYFGAAMEMISYFTNLGYPCPELTNPCDYYVDLATVDRKSEETETETSIRVNFLIDLYNRRDNITENDLLNRPNPPSYSAVDSDNSIINRIRSHSTENQGIRKRVVGEMVEVDVNGMVVDEVEYFGKMDNYPEVAECDIIHDVIDSINDKPPSLKDGSNDASSLSRESETDKPSNDDGGKTVINIINTKEINSVEPIILQEPREQTEIKLNSNNQHVPGNSPFVVHTYDNVAYEDDDLCLQEESPTKDSTHPVPVQQVELTVGNDAYSKTTVVSSYDGDEQGNANIDDKPGFFLQFWVLLRRTLRNNLEDYGFLFVQAVEALFMSIIIGVIYWNLSMDQLGAKDRFGMLYVLAALYPYMVILDVIGKFYKERFILYFEMVDGLYTAGPYFLAKVLGDIPEHTVFLLFYCLPVYFLAGLQLDPGLVFQQFAILYMIVLCSRSLALFASAAVSAYPLSVLIAQSVFSMFLLSSGFIFNLDNIFIGMKWVSYISYIKWGYQAMCETELIGLNFTCKSLVPETCVTDGADAMEAYSLDGGAIWQSSLVLLGEMFLFFSLFFVATRFKSQKPHQQ